MGQLPPPNPPPSGAGYYVQPVVVYNQGTHGLAVFSGLAGIFSWFVCPFVGALAAIITGHIALSDLKRAPRPGRGWALTGVILGYLHLAVYGLLVLLFVFGIFGTMYLISVQPTPSP